MDTNARTEAVSAAIHGLALLAALPATAALIRRGGRRHLVPMLAYGFGLVACFAASTACHAFAAAGADSRVIVAADHMAIYLLIAGTYTPISAALLPTKDRARILTAVWVAALVGIGLAAGYGPLPPIAATTFYLAMGWGGLWCYRAMRPRLTHRRLAPVPLGGVFYSVGASFHVAQAPVLWEGVFGAHELFHVLVVIGAAAHYLFIYTHAAPAEAEDPMPAVAAAGLVTRLAARPRGPFRRRLAAAAASGSPAHRRSRAASPPRTL